MWRCIRCEKENQDVEEKCTGCGHGKTMNYIQHRTLSKVSEYTAENWRISVDPSEDLRKQGMEHLQKAIEIFERTNTDTIDIWKMTVAELKEYFETGGIASVKEKPVLMADNDEKYVFRSDILRESIHKIEFVKINRNQVPNSAWDVSGDKNGTVWAWTEDAGRTLKIGAENQIYANPDCKGMFKNYTEVNEIEFNNMLDTACVINMEDMFNGCKSLSELDVSGFDTSSVTNMNGMFYVCESLLELNVSEWNTANVTDMSFMFYECKNLMELDVSGFDTANVTNMKAVFYDCEGLTKLDVSRLATGNVTDMSFMFWGCKNLMELDVSGFDTVHVMDMRSMFSGCEGLTKLDVSRLVTGNVTDMAFMFWGCKNLMELDVSGFDTVHVMDMRSMF
ncbi:BspA family leucine-rich repeat surface protein, partial [Blautia obeum]|uniref:BspA family leucine-rich repeat surface protein n=1 Tax=Blautia obeum TaxID=40520 RepID=UPI0035622302